MFSITSPELMSQLSVHPKTIKFSIMLLSRRQHKLLTRQTALPCLILFGEKFRTQIWITSLLGCKRLIIFMRNSSEGVETEGEGNQLYHMLSCYIDYKLVRIKCPVCSRYAKSGSLKLTLERFWSLPYPDVFRSPVL